VNLGTKLTIFLDN